jgi:putative PIN family toxin of toxin-antitoxin system
VKIFVDTNVWLSAFFGRGLCADLIAHLVHAGVEILLDPTVAGEFDRIARSKFQATDEQLADAKLFFTEACIHVPAANTPVSEASDPSDALILAAALAAGADLFVTGDKALFELGEVQGMPILDVRTAYLRLRGLG